MLGQIQANPTQCQTAPAGLAPGRVGPPAEQLPRPQRVLSALASLNESIDQLMGLVDHFVGEPAKPVPNVRQDTPNVSLGQILDIAPDAILNQANRINAIRELLFARLG